MNRTIKDATVKVFHYEDLESLKAHVLAFVTAYNFAKHLSIRPSAMNGRTTPLPSTSTRANSFRDHTRRQSVVSSRHRSPRLSNGAASLSNGAASPQLKPPVPKSGPLHAGVSTCRRFDGASDDHATGQTRESRAWPLSDQCGVNPTNHPPKCNSLLCPVHRHERDSNRKICMSDTPL